VPIPLSGAAKESNLPTLGLPGPAGFEGLDLQGCCDCLGVFSFGGVRSDWVKFAEFGTRLGTRRLQQFSRRTRTDRGMERRPSRGRGLPVGRCASRPDTPRGQLSFASGAHAAVTREIWQSMGARRKCRAAGGRLLPLLALAALGIWSTNDSIPLRRCMAGVGGDDEGREVHAPHRPGVHRRPPGRQQAPSFARQRLTRVLTQPHSKQLVDPRLTGTRSQGRWGLRDSPAGDLGDVRLNER